MDQARRTILDRRARFVAAAIASLGAGCDRAAPQPCLSAVSNEVRDAAPATTTSAPAIEEVGPMACLSEAPHPAPMPCLKVAPKPTDGGR